MKILIVEDDRLSSNCFKKNLKNLGYDNTMEVFSGIEAIEAVKDYKPDLIFMDVGLPGIDGIETVELLNKESEGNTVVYVTGYADKSTIKRAENTSPFGFLPKPYDNRELKSITEEVRKKKNL